MTEETKAPVANPCRVKSAPVRLSFQSLFKLKKKSLDSDVMTYQATLLVPPTGIKVFGDAVKAAMLKKFNKLLPLQTGDRKNPIHKCEEKEYAGYEPGWFFIAMHSEAKPPVIGPDKLPITDESRVYSGCWVHVIGDAFGWDNQYGKGVSFELKAVQLVRDGSSSDPGGARLDGRGKPVDPDAAFDAVELPPDETGGAGWDPLA